MKLDKNIIEAEKISIEILNKKAKHILEIYILEQTKLELMGSGDFIKFYAS